MAGVVNLVPYIRYDGVKLEYYDEGDHRGDFRRNEISLLAGKTFGAVDPQLRTPQSVADAVFTQFRTNDSVGVRNLVDRMPQKVGMIGGVDAQMQGVLGRVVYARVNYEF